MCPHGVRVPAGEVQRGPAEDSQSVLQPSSNPPDRAGQGGDGAPESGDTFYYMIIQS